MIDLTTEQKAYAFDMVHAAGVRLEDGLPGVLSGQLSITSHGVRVVLFRDMGDATAHAEYTLGYQEIALANTDLLDTLISTMHEKLMAAAPDTLGGDQTNVR